MKVLPAYFNVLLVVAVLLLCGYAMKALGDCTLEGCDNNGAVLAGCGSGENYCVGNAETCKNDTSKILCVGFFECGLSYGDCDCGTSIMLMGLCYTTYKCKYDDEKKKCVSDEDTADPSYDWEKDNFWCPGSIPF